MAKVARASLAALARALRCRNSAYFIQYSSFLRLDPEPNPRRDAARDFCHGLLAAVFRDHSCNSIIGKQAIWKGANFRRGAKMYICLNRATTGGGVAYRAIRRVGRRRRIRRRGCRAGLWGRTAGTAALRDLYSRLNMKFGGWGPPLDHRTDPARREEAMKKLVAQAAVAAELGIDFLAATLDFPIVGPPLFGNLDNPRRHAKTRGDSFGRPWPAIRAGMCEPLPHPPIQET